MIHFHKYHGAGNDFILIDNRTQNLLLDTRQIAFLCHRRFGIGADGLMLLETEPGYDFRMVYYNADGRESTMCGNGGRCITAFARDLNIISDKAFFLAIDGAHHARYTSKDTIALQMNEVHEIQHFDNYAILNTGSPHYIVWSDDVAHTDVVHQGREIRNRERFAPNGINVNFAQITDDGLYVRTYERGVEDETLSCGTGVTACAIAASGGKTGNFHTPIQTPGGNLSVSFNKNTADTAVDVVLTGPAIRVYEGQIMV